MTDPMIRRSAKEKPDLLWCDAHGSLPAKHGPIGQSTQFEDHQL